MAESILRNILDAVAMEVNWLISEPGPAGPAADIPAEDPSQTVASLGSDEEQRDETLSSESTEEDSQPAGPTSGAAVVEFLPRSSVAAVSTLAVTVTPREISSSLEARGVVRSEVIVDVSFAKKMISEDEIVPLSQSVETVFAGLAFGVLKGFPDASCVHAERGLFNLEEAISQHVFAASCSFTYAFFFRR